MEAQAYMLDGSTTTSSGTEIKTEGRIDLHENGDITGTLHEARILGGKWNAAGDVEFKLNWNSLVTTFTGNFKKKLLQGTCSGRSGATFKFKMRTVRYQKRGHGSGDAMFTVQVITGDVLNGSTDSKVKIQLQGTKAGSKPIRLGDDNVVSLYEECFRRGQVDKFDIYLEDLAASDLGNLTSVTISHDSNPPPSQPNAKPPIFTNAGWYLDQVAVFDHKRSFWHIFPCDRWLDKNRDDAQISRTLTSVSKDQAEALQVTLNDQEKVNEELLLENQRCRHIMAGDERLRDTDQACKETDRELMEADQELKRLAGLKEEREEQCKTQSEEVDTLGVKSQELQAELERKRAEFETLGKEDNVLSSDIKAKMENMAGLSVSILALEERIKETDAHIAVLEAQTDAKELLLKEWRAKLEEKEGMVEATEARYKETHETLQQCKADLDGCKKDVDVHQQWALKLRTLLEKQMLYKQDLQTQIDQITVNTQELQLELERALRLREDVREETEREKNLTADLMQQRDEVAKERAATQAKYSGEQEALAQELFDAEALLETTKANTDRARERDSSLQEEGVRLQQSSEVLENHNYQLAARIVRNEQLTLELQRRAKKAKQLQKDANKIIERLLVEARSLGNQKEISRPLDKSSDLSTWPPVKDLLHFRSKLDHLYEIFRQANSPDLIMSERAERLARKKSARAAKECEDDEGEGEGEVMLRSTSGLLAELWEDNDRLTRVRREYAEAEHLDRLKSSRTLSPQKPTPSQQARNPGERRVDTYTLAQLSSRDLGEERFSSPPNHENARAMSSRPLHSRESGASSSGDENHRGRSNSTRTSAQGPNSLPIIPGGGLANVPTLGAKSLVAVTGMGDDDFMHTIKEWAPPQEREKVGPKVGLSDTPGLAAIQAKWDEQHKEYKKMKSSRKPRPPANALAGSFPPSANSDAARPMTAEHGNVTSTNFRSQPLGPIRAMSSDTYRRPGLKNPGFQPPSSYTPMRGRTPGGLSAGSGNIPSVWIDG